MAETNKKYAGFGVRLVAMLIDGVIIGFLSSLIGNFFYSTLFKAPIRMGPFSATGSVKVQPLSALITALYAILLWVNWNGQTLGKKVMKIRVVTENGEPVGYKEAIVRYLSYILSGLALGLGFLWVIWDEKKQGWHDKIAGTLVVKE